MQDPYTPTYILTWNPRKFNWTDYHLACEYIKNIGDFYFDWSCRSKLPKDYDRFILLMQGMGEKNGIVGTGIFTSEPYTVKNTPYGSSFTDITFNRMWNYENEPYVHTSQLTMMFRGQCWTPQMSGTRIRSSILPDLWSLINNRDLHLCNTKDKEL